MATTERPLLLQSSITGGGRRVCYTLCVYVCACVCACVRACVCACAPVCLSVGNGETILMVHVISA